MWNISKIPVGNFLKLKAFNEKKDNRQELFNDVKNHYKRNDIKFIPVFAFGIAYSCYVDLNTKNPILLHEITY